MSYLAAGRTLLLGMRPVPIGRIGDQVLAVDGRRDGVNEVTVCVRRGAYFVRVSATAPDGDPFPDATLKASQFLTDVQGRGTSASARSVNELLPTPPDLPIGFVVSEEGYRDGSEIASAFLRPVEAGRVPAACGFQENVYRYFSRDDAYSPYPGAATSIEVSLHLFGSASGAADALPYYADGLAEAIGIRVAGFYDVGNGAFVLIGSGPNGGIESTVYMLTGNVLARISSVASDGDPTADALAVAFIIAGLG